MDDKMYHPVGLPKRVSSNRELGRVVARMRYDQVIEFLIGFIEETNLEKESDSQHGKPQLSALLDLASGDAAVLLADYQRILGLCRPYMQHEFKEKDPP